MSLSLLLTVAAGVLCGSADLSGWFPELIRCTQPTNRTARAVTELPPGEGIVAGVAPDLLRSRKRKLAQGLIEEGKGPASAHFVWRVVYRAGKDGAHPPQSPTATFSYQRELPDHSRAMIAMRTVPIKFHAKRNGEFVAEVESPLVPLEGRIWVVPIFRSAD